MERGTTHFLGLQDEAVRGLACARRLQVRDRQAIRGEEYLWFQTAECAERTFMIRACAGLILRTKGKGGLFARPFPVKSPHWLGKAEVSPPASFVA